MTNRLVTLLAIPLFGACVARVGGPPPAEPPPAHVHEHEHDHGGPPPAAAEPRVITGRIVDAVTKQPIDRASVDITSPAFKGEMTVQVGPDGVYRTNEIPPGDFKIRCRREGYEAINRSATMSNGTAHLDFEMVKLHR